MVEQRQKDFSPSPPFSERRGKGSPGAQRVKDPEARLGNTPHCLAIDPGRHSEVGSTFVVWLPTSTFAADDESGQV
jgi:hypothetical protein